MSLSDQYVSTGKGFSSVLFLSKVFPRRPGKSLRQLLAVGGARALILYSPRLPPYVRFPIAYVSPLPFFTTSQATSRFYEYRSTYYELAISITKSKRPTSTSWNIFFTQGNLYILSPDPV